jgi:hypothetical protein
MNVVPRNLVDQIQFFEFHAPMWVERAGEIGVDPLLAAELAAQTAAAREALAAQQQAMQAARSATQTLRHAMEAMGRTGGAVIGQVKARAATGGSGVYIAASVPAPKQPSPMDAPGQPDRFAVKLIGSMGLLAITWRCRNPRGAKGTMYNVSRQIGFDGPVEFLATVGAKRFIDATLPAGATRVTYAVRAVRSTKVGPEGRFDISIGGARMPLGMGLPTMGKAMAVAAA